MGKASRKRTHSHHHTRAGRQPDTWTTSAEQEARVREWLRANDNARWIAGLAWKGYVSQGRGALIAFPPEGPKGGAWSKVGYISDRRLRADGENWADQYTADLVGRYDPEKQVVVISPFENAGFLVQCLRSNPPPPAVAAELAGPEHLN
jgi:hypothetical protein